MALVVEDGTGLATAESYISVADADTRHSNLGNTAWTGTTAVKEAALRKATEYIEQRYRLRWKGVRVISTQALSWPRTAAMVDGYESGYNSVPTEIANACADLALKSLSETLNADQTRAVIREKVGPLETEYSEFSPQANRYPAIDGMLAAYLKGSPAQAMLVRA